MSIRRLCAAVVFVAIVAGCSGGGDTTSPPVTTTYTLTVVKAGNGTGTVTSSPAGINCGSD